MSIFTDKEVNERKMKMYCETIAVQKQEREKAFIAWLNAKQGVESYNMLIIHIETKIAELRKLGIKRFTVEEKKDETPAPTDLHHGGN